MKIQHYIISTRIGVSKGHVRFAFADFLRLARIAWGAHLVSGYKVHPFPTFYPFFSPFASLYVLCLFFVSCCVFVPI